jgi:hypothetical protein
MRDVWTTKLAKVAKGAKKGDFSFVVFACFALFVVQSLVAVQRPSAPVPHNKKAPAALASGAVAEP